MPEMNAVIGYLADEAASAIGAKGVPSGPLEISVGEGSNTYVRIQPDAVAGVWTGPSKNGQTGVQVLLKENATVETITRGPAADFLQPIKDSTFVPMRPPIFVIYIPPFVAEKLGG
jgi:hypothetical protein